MADRKQKGPGNISGRYYVDDTCTDCDFCRSVAPRIFQRHDDSGVSFVHHQPVTPAELAEAEEGREGCPTDSIGHDG